MLVPRPNLSPTVVAGPTAKLLAVVRHAYEAGVCELTPFERPDPVLDARRQVLTLDAAVRRLVRDRGDRLKAQNLLAELRLRQERAIGRWLAAHVRHTGGGDRRSRSAGGTVAGDLPDGVSKNESSRFQRLAAVPASAFDRYLSDARDTGREITTAAALRLAPPPNRPAPKSPSPAVPPVATRLDILLTEGATFGTVYLDPPPGADLGAVPVARFARPDARVCLWVAADRLAEGEGLLRGWRFAPRGLLVPAAPVSGATRWHLVQEALLVGVRTKCTLRPAERASWPAGGRGEPLSRTQAARAAVERLGPGPHLDVFGTEPAAGWVAAGSGGGGESNRQPVQAGGSQP